MISELPYRSARFAGSWYADDPDALRREIDGYLEASVSDVLSPKLAVLPHAGLFYSGRGIAGLFSHLSGSVERVCILSPSHYTYLPIDRITTAEFSELETPLGDLPYQTICQGLPESMRSCDAKIIGEEHAVEMFLPFIAREAERRSDSISVTIGMISHLSSSRIVHELAQQILRIIGREEILSGKTVLIASSDFTHYGYRFGHTPFGTEDIIEVQRAVELQDRAYAQLFAEGAVEELIAQEKKEKPSICGFAPGLLVSAIAADLGLSGTIADYYTSNDLSKNPLDEFVSYCTILWE